MTGWRLSLAGFGLGALVGLGVLAVNVGFAPAELGAEDSAGLRDVLHSPPSLVLAGEPVRLRYDVVCQSDEFGAPCSLRGTVFVRKAGGSEFQALPLASESESLLGADVPASLQSAGDAFEYYATIEAQGNETMTTPPGGAEAPQRTWVARALPTADLGPTSFTGARTPDEQVAVAEWGAGPADLGLISGVEQARIGPSGFDIAPDGSAVVLDQVNARLAFYGPDAAQPQRRVQIPFDGGEGDVAVDGLGRIYVLDQSNVDRPKIRAFSAAGEVLATTDLAEHSGDMLRTGAAGVVAHSYPSDMWLPVGNGANLHTAGRQIAGAGSSRESRNGVNVLVRAYPSEARFAVVAGSRVVRAWRVTSPVALGEVQLAEPYGGGLLVVVRRWTESAAEFSVLTLSAQGVQERFTLEPREWAESAALSRFRLARGKLYQLRSTPSDVEIVAFDLTKGGTK